MIKIENNKLDNRKTVEKIRKLINILQGRQKSKVATQITSTS